MEVARLWVRGLFTDEDAQAADHVERDAALAAFGLYPEGGEPALPTFDLWPEHELAFDLWCLSQPHMRHGLDGPTGLDHGAIAADIRRSRRIRLPGSPRKRAHVWRDLGTIERAALREWSTMRAEQKR